MKVYKKFFTQTKTGDYEISIWFDENDKAFLVKVPSLPGVVTFGKTIEEAKKMAKDAIELYCDCLIDEGKIIIDDKRKVYGRIPKSNVITIK
jgi:predicted RNase H-like HicB family nuclease